MEKKLETIPAWDVRKVKSKKEVIKEKQKNNNSSLCDIDGLMSFKEFGVGATIPEVQRKSRASRRHCERRLWSLCRIYWTGLIGIANDGAQKVMDIISRLPGCSGQAADAVSAYSQVRMEDASTLFKIPKSECPYIWIRLPRHKWPKSLEYIEDPFVPLERNLYGHPLAGLLWERQFERALMELGW